MKIGDATPDTLMKLWARVEPQVQKARAMEEAAQALAAAVHTEFAESVVLARVFLTVPYLALLGTVEQFVRRLAESAGVAGELKATTPVLSLLGTHGEEAEWNDRRRSKEHMGIPLVSSAFVDTIPMIARLLKELGVPLGWVDSQDSDIIERTMGRAAGLFFVEDAAEATDHQGRKIIAAQDFVSAYKVKSVFGTGGAYTGGQIVVLVVFCRERLERRLAERFLGLAELFKDRTKSLVAMSRLFAEGYAH
ncbi:MAG: hypothetical protein HYY26_07340 [Acidobacteria bacterium]|nr:hypothetical protein [Acidobacteriota bacterium]